MTSDANGKIVVPVWSDNGIVKPVINDDGRIQVTVGDVTLTVDINLKSSDITLPTAEQSPLSNIEARAYGYDGGTWRKSPIVRGYRGVQREYMIETATAAGTLRCNGTSVPTGWVWVIEGFTFTHTDVAAKNVQYGVWTGATNVHAGAYVAVPANLWHGGPIDLTIRQGERFTVQYYASASGKVLQVWYCARTIQVDM